jgi:hypothetical protein
MKPVSEERVEWVVQRRQHPAAESEWKDVTTGVDAEKVRRLVAWCRQNADGCEFRLVRRTVREEVCE